MDDEHFHHMMQAQDRKFYQTFSDQVFLFNDLCDSQVYEKCDLAVFSSESTKDLGKERIQSTSKLPVWNEDNSQFLDSDLEEVFSESEFEDEDVLAVSDRGMKISKALTNRVDTFLSDDNQVRRFIVGLEEEEYLTASEGEDSDDDYTDAGEDILDSDNEDSLSTDNSGYGRSVVSQIQAENNDDFLAECCHLIAMTQPEEDDQSIIADIFKNSPRIACVEELSRHNSMEDIRELDMPQDSLGNPSMMQFNEATNSDVENHAILEAKVACDSSRFTANSVKMSNDLRIDRSVAKVKSLLDVQEDQLAESLDVPSQCSAVSACVGSSSGDLILDRMENTKSELNPSNFILNVSQDVAFDVTEENDEEGIWSILTDNLHYLKVNPSCDSSPIKFQNPEIEKLTNTAKKKLFNADNNNVPEKVEISSEQKELKFHRKFQTNDFERDQQYDGLNVTIDEKFDPTKHITTTYLWTNRSERLLEPNITTTEASWFPEGNFHITTKG